MTMRLLPSDAFPASRLMLATKPSARLQGMLFSPPSSDIMMLLPCKDVHTFGMQYALDIAFLDKQGKVLAVRRDVLPNRRVKHEGAVAVLERRALPREVWFEEGDELALGPYQLCAQDKASRQDPGKGPAQAREAKRVSVKPRKKPARKSYE